MPEIMSGGAALFDMDGDGDLDAYLVQAGRIESPTERPPNRLFRNRGAGYFEDVTAGSGAGDTGYGNGVAVGDFDGDGDEDLYVTNLGPNVLLRNDGDGRFVDVSPQAGVDHTGWGTSAVFFDFDRDGDLDLFVTNYLVWSRDSEIACFDLAGAPDYCAPENYDAPAPDVLFRNEGDGTFSDVTVAMGMGVFGPGLGVAAADFNSDGWPDLFVANDGALNQLWLNRRGVAFSDDALAWGAATDRDGKAKAGMGVAVADVEGDGDQDVLVVNLVGESDSFHLNRGEYFEDAGASLGLAFRSRPFTRFGVGWADFDNDGHLDLYLANGRVGREGPRLEEDPYAEPNLLLRGTAEAKLEGVSPEGGVAPPLIATSRAAAFGDVDGDGGVDILVVNRDGPAHLLRNLAGAGRQWLSLLPVEANGRVALGARVVTRVGTTTHTCEVRSAYSYQAANDPACHLGLGSAAGADGVRIEWPDGTTECWKLPSVNRRWTVRRGEGVRCGTS